MIDRIYMKEALMEAEKAYAKGEVPIGAVLVFGGKIIARAHNLKEERKDPTAHAEILAVKEAAASLHNWRLNGSSIYVTVEPCPMCAGALVQARVSTLIFGAWDSKAGAAGSLVNLTQFPQFNHRMEVYGGIMEDECKAIMQRFFEKRR
ncbi:tRNA adenosine(34) deaminase TadA [Candidatus Formimonas warabiya]|uniref:tRNA-specific adenosine deaminase n=1 Tax=Formimonas warabiya TaxID=1761012 RepID=A0A3G1KW27_FORW1|nr:tRNA adenosine(34) deaminase TadA [Candidatus Formimonas warabiya]ATW26415.1 tRNA-specific adenosine deaminase [Candidatus Formimonas warabiya]